MEVQEYKKSFYENIQKNWHYIDCIVLLLHCIGRGVASSKGGTVLNSAESNSRPKGYRGRVEAGEITDIADGGIYAGFSVSTTHGYQFTPDFFLGAGIGLDYHHGLRTVFMPIFVNLRGYFTDKRKTPFVDLKIGYSPINKTGLYLSPSVGLSFGRSKKCAFNLSIGYNMQQYRFYYREYYGYGYAVEYQNKKLLNGVSLKFGVEF